ncbi:hypothetical protein M501DRAFT_734420 [Patellaria atrata CBS 101060]|uniref:Uncharacterized protein n=1 Tax=Patellaria atrata CBS 101060 TaxID=1346257 RepID=A0A9P4SDT3_9PEZI|nr:hypothetical protein M501DRAFT_734420 [Patellaria atrata CBS 101060]
MFDTYQTSPLPKSQPQSPPEQTGQPLNIRYDLSHYQKAQTPIGPPSQISLDITNTRSKTIIRPLPISHPITLRRLAPRPTRTTRGIRISRALLPHSCLLALPLLRPHQPIQPTFPHPHILAIRRRRQEPSCRFLQDALQRLEDQLRFLWVCFRLNWAHRTTHALLLRVFCSRFTATLFLFLVTRSARQPPPGLNDTPSESLPPLDHHQLPIHHSYAGLLHGAPAAGAERGLPHTADISGVPRRIAGCEFVEKSGMRAEETEIGAGEGEGCCAGAGMGIVGGGAHCAYIWGRREGEIMQRFFEFLKEY